MEAEKKLVLNGYQWTITSIIFIVDTDLSSPVVHMTDYKVETEERSGLNQVSAAVDPCF